MLVPTRLLNKLFSLYFPSHSLLPREFNLEQLPNPTQIVTLNSQSTDLLYVSQTTSNPFHLQLSLVLLDFPFLKFTSFLNIFCSNFLVITEHTKSGFRSLESVFTGWLKRNVTEKYENLAFFKVFFPPSFLPSFLPSFEKEPVQEADGQKGRDREKQTPCLLNLKPCAEPHLVRSQEPEIITLRS